MNFQESSTILNACTKKKSGNLLNSPRVSQNLKKLSNMKVTVILTENGTLGTVTKGLAQGLMDLEIRGQVETIHTTALLRSVRILGKVLENLCTKKTKQFIFSLNSYLDI